MRYIMFTLTGKLLALLLTCHSVFTYENVYDIIERQNQRRYFREPLSWDRKGGASNQYDFDRHPTFNGKPDSIYSSVRPRLGEYNQLKSGINFFGNGYDNIGNGNIKLRDRLHIFPEETFNRRSHSRFNPKYSHEEYPNFYDTYYFVRPRHKERSFSDSGKNLDKIYEGSFGQKENKEVFKIDRLLANHEDNKQRNSLENFKNNQESVVSDARKKENFGETSHTDKNSENKSTQRSNRISKKGHITKGFSTHHHKDETGNTTTFYDEYADHGGQSDVKDLSDSFGTKTMLEHFGNVENGKFFKESGGQSGSYDEGSVKDHHEVEKDIIFNDNRFDKDEQFHSEGGQENLGHRRNYYFTDGRHDRHDYHIPYYNYY